jgi:outer membrane lipoprotein carrier protein
VLFFVCSGVYASEAVDNLNQLLQSFQSMRANFVQTITDVQGQVGVQQTGVLVLQKPNQFRWEVSAPNAQLFISNGKNLWNVEPDLDQVTVTPLTQNLSTVPLLLLSGRANDVQKLFKVTVVDDHSYRLVPLTQDSLVRELDLVFVQQHISEITITNMMGQKAHVQFSQVEINAVIPPQAFVYQVPAGMQVLTQ